VEYLTKGVYPPKPVRPERWSFQAADKELDKMIFKWRRLTLDILEKCFLVYEELALPGARTDLSPNGERLPSWTEWVKAKGFGKNTLTRHFARLEWIEAKEQTPAFLQEDKYRVIYADPPWFYGDHLTEGYGASVHHYKAMKTEKICELGEEIRKLIADDAVLFLWTTVPVLPEALQVVEAWGFEYKAQFVWDKVKHNYGHYNSVRHELLLIATKGVCTPEAKELFDSVQTIERSEKHSAKPAEFRAIIDTLYPSGKALELFARTGPSGRWEVWGAETELQEPA
jgi:N6-adenosine-specific RNA methylase IME4